MTVEIFLDCGAPSIYNLLSKKKKNKVMGSHIKQRRHDDFSYTETQEYKDYREGYIEHVKSMKHVLSVYPNLDVINNAELTYKNQKLLEKKGIQPAPVWHFGSDVKWLRRYLEEGYSYICMGGMVPNSTKVLQPALDKLWMHELVDKHGMPKVKVHGFAMTSFVLMYRYPWFSVDSKSWIDYARFGRVLVPSLKDGKYNWCNPFKVAVSWRSMDKNAANRQNHLQSMPSHMRRYVDKYLKEIGVPLGKSSSKKVEPGYKLRKQEELWIVPNKLVEVIEEPGVCNTNSWRMDVNLYLYRKIEDVVPTWPWSIFDAVKLSKKRGFFS